MNNITKNQISKNSAYLPQMEINPAVHPSATIRNTQIVGDVTVDENTHIVNAVIRADEGTPFYIGKNSNIQDFVILHGYATRNFDQIVYENLVKVDGNYYSIYIGSKVSVSHGVLIHGPSYIGNNTFLGFKSTIDAATIGSNVEIGAHSYIKNVKIPDNIAIRPGSIILSEEDIAKYTVNRTELNIKIADVNIELAKTYSEDYANINK